MVPRWVSVLPLLLCLLSVARPGFATGQLPSVGMRGEVWDSASSQIMAGVSVVLGAHQVVTATDETGAFYMPVVPVGANTLILSAAGYRTAVFRFEVSEALSGDLDIGVLLLRRGEDPVTRLDGLVMARNGASIPRASVVLNGREVGLTDEDGQFRVGVPTIGNNLLEIRRIGYVPHATQIQLHGDAQVEITLQPLPVQLDPILVEGDRAVFARRRIREFYDRRETGLGTYFTRWEIEDMNPLFLTDVFRSVAGIRLTPGDFGRNIVSMTRGSCAPQVYVDGLQLEDFNIDDYLRPEHVAGIEVYNSGMMAPPEYTDGTCGAIVIWSR